MCAGPRLPALPDTDVISGIFMVLGVKMWREEGVGIVVVLWKVRVMLVLTYADVWAEARATRLPWSHVYIISSFIHKHLWHVAAEQVRDGPAKVSEQISNRL